MRPLRGEACLVSAFLATLLLAGSVCPAFGGKLASLPLVFSLQSGPVLDGQNGGTYYVAASGDDNAPGTLDRPWKSIQHAADILDQGSIVYVRSGVYSESVLISRSGSPNAPITFAAYARESVTVDGGGSEWAGFVIGEGVSHVVIDGFILRNFRGTGVDMQGTNSHITLSRLDVSAASTGVRITWGYSGDEPMFGPVDHITIHDSHIHDNDLAGIDCTPGPCTDLVFQRLTIENNGVGMESFGADGVAVERGYPVLIEDVVIRNNGGDGLDLNSRDRGPTPGVVVRRCIVAGNHFNGVKLWGSARLENCILYDSGLTPLTAGAFSNLDLYIVNNVVAYNMVHGRGYSARGWAMDIGYADEGEPTPGNVRVTLRNNIFAFNSYNDPDGQTGLYLGHGVVLTESNNLYFSREDGEIYVASTDRWYSREEIVSGVWRADSGQSAGDIGADPKFVDMVGGDFHVEALSPAIDAGTSVDAPLNDLDGGLRPQGPGYDIGAYEHGSLGGHMIDGCAVFPANNIWNAPVASLPSHPDSAAYVASIGAEEYAHADFGSGTWEGGPIGIPYVTVPGSQLQVAVSFEYADESDLGPYPIPADPPIEGGSDSTGDRHVLIVDRDRCRLYELYAAYPQPDGAWHAGSGAIFDLSSNALRPESWTSADAAGLPILPGLVRYDEVLSGEINHALRFTAPETRRAYVWPARHYASSLTGDQYPPMGQRFRLKADYDISGFSPEVQIILRALKKYGMILADNGAPWYISGVPDERWNNDVLHELHQIHGSAFEAVDVSSLMVNPDSGQVRDNHDVITFYADPTSGTITADGVTKTNAVTGTYSAGQRVHVVANPPGGYSFTMWETKGVSVDNPLAQETYMTVSMSGWLKAHFQQQASMMLRSSSILGNELSGIRMKVDRSYRYTPFSLEGLHGVHTFTAPTSTSVNGVKYYFVRWEDELGAVLSRNKSLTYDVKSGRTLSAVYGPKQYKLTVYVKDTSTRNPVGGATVQVIYMGQTLVAMTNLRGKVVFAGIYAGQTFKLRIIIDGNVRYETTLTLTRNTTYRAAI